MLNHVRQGHSCCFLGSTLYVIGGIKFRKFDEKPIERLVDAPNKVGIDSGQWEILQIQITGCIYPLVVPLNSYEIMILGRENYENDDCSEKRIIFNA